MDLMSTYVVTTAGSPSGIAATARATAIWENKSKATIVSPNFNLLFNNLTGQYIHLQLSQISNDKNPPIAERKFL